jgi:hypothetical protein
MICTADSSVPLAVVPLASAAVTRAITMSATATSAPVMIRAGARQPIWVTVVGGWRGGDEAGRCMIDLRGINEA